MARKLSTNDSYKPNGSCQSVADKSFTESVRSVIESISDSLTEPASYHCDVRFQTKHAKLKLA